METLSAAPPETAVALFNGRDLNNWTTRDGQSAEWRVDDQVLHVVPGTGDIMTKERLADFYLHLEFRCPDMPQATGQAKANSGVFLQGRYEIQVLDSYGWAVPGMGDCGAIYDQFALLVNACKKAMEWQTYDVEFTNAVVKDGKKISNPRMTLKHNGVVIHKDLEIKGKTGGARRAPEGTPGPIKLQGHGNPLQFRNVWIVEH